MAWSEGKTVYRVEDVEVYQLRRVDLSELAQPIRSPSKIEHIRFEWEFAFISEGGKRSSGVDHVGLAGN